MRRRAPNRALTRVLVVVLAAFAFGGAGATSASAADPLPPPILPPGVTAPPDGGGNDVPSGPTYLITPGTGGTELGAPVNQEQIDEAEKALSRAPGKAKGKAPAGTKQKSGATVSGPDSPARVQARAARADLAAPSPLEPWWLVGSGVLLLYVLLELARAAVGRRDRRTE